MSSVEMSALSKGECWDRLRSTSVGRIAYLDARHGVEVFPMNYVVDHGTIVLRTAEGTKLTALAAGRAVAFEADGGDVGAGSSWAVVVRGKAESIEARDEILDAFELDLTTWHGSSKPFFVRVVPRKTTGHRSGASERSTTSPA